MKSSGYRMEEDNKRDRVFSTFAVLFAVPALSNISKPLSGGRARFVFFGTKTTGVANAWQKALAPWVHA